MNAISSKIHKWENSARGDFLCLMFHSVGPLQSTAVGPPHEYGLSLEAFLKMINQISKFYEPISIDSLAQAIVSRSELPKKAVVITFDDGYKDTFELAAPILEKEKVPYAIYISPNLIDCNTIPAELVLGNIIERCESIEFCYGDKFFFDNCVSLDQKRSTYLTVRRLLFTPSKLRNVIISNVKFAKLFAESVEALKATKLFMDWENISDLGRQPMVTIGNHGMNHKNLAYMSEDEALEEIVSAETRIAAQIGIRARNFSFPYGGHTASVRSILRKLGYNSAITAAPTITGCIDQYNIPRVQATEGVVNLYGV